MSDKVVFKKSTSRPAQRARDADVDHGDDGPSTVDVPIALAKIKSKAKRAQPRSKLSFGVDDDDEAAEESSFQIKKSGLSRKLALGSHPALLPATLDQATIGTRSNGAPVYDQAYLSELRATTQSARPPTNNDVHDVDVSMTIDESTSEFLGISETTETVIPSQSRITAAKEQREHLRVGATEHDYISLSVTKRADIPQGPHPESRLVREEDEVGECDDEFAEYTSAQERIALGKKARKMEASKRRDTMKEMIAEVVDEDEETLEWEREQLRRGGHDPATSQPTSVKQTYRAAQIPPAIDIPVLGQAIARFQRSLATLTDSHAMSTGAIASLAEQRTELDTRETELRSMIVAAESKRAWFAEFRDWIESMATFLDEKFPRLEKLEEEHLSVLKARAEMITRRRSADDEDDLSMVFGIVSKSSTELGLADDSRHPLPTSNSTVLRKEQRTARIARRTRRQTRKTPTDADNREEGYSTDSSLAQSDALDYQRALESITTHAEDILSDVHSDEFKDPNRGLAKWFAEWRERYVDSYAGAWGGLGLVGAWEFWVRLEILGWNPFESQGSLDQFTWYSSLYQYSRPSNSNYDDSELGPDGDIVSAIISTAVVPCLCKILKAGALDPYSAKDVRRMVDLAEQVEASIGMDSNKFEMMLKSVHAVFDDATSNAVNLLAPFVKLNRPPFDPEATPARQRLLCRIIKFLENMLRWRKYAGDKHSISRLCTRLVNDYILPIAESGWEVGGERKVRQAIAMLPQELAGSIRVT